MRYLPALLRRTRLEDITICDILIISPRVSVNIKSGGNLLIFLLTAWFRTLVSTPYNSAKSRSSNTFSLRRKMILLTIVSTGISFFIIPSNFRCLNLRSQFVTSSFLSERGLRFIHSSYITIKLFNIQVVLILKLAGKQRCNYYTKQWVNDQDYWGNGNDYQ